MTQEALKLAEDYAHMRAIWYVESLYGTSASHTELREKVMLGAHQALKEALAQTQEPVAWMHVQGNYKEPSFRELADDEVERGWEQYPLYNTPPQRNEQCNYPDCKCPTENPCLKKLAQPEQEPLKIFQYNCTCGRTMKFESVHGVVAPQRTEQNFCSRCGKRVGGIDSIHTCTPPMEMNT
jgi:hypothetical protein